MNRNNLFANKMFCLGFLLTLCFGCDVQVKHTTLYWANLCSTNPQSDLRWFTLPPWWPNTRSAFYFFIFLVFFKSKFNKCIKKSSSSFYKLMFSLSPQGPMGVWRGGHGRKASRKSLSSDLSVGEAGNRKSRGRLEFRGPRVNSRHFYLIRHFDWFHLFSKWYSRIVWSVFCGVLYAS